MVVQGGELEERGFVGREVGARVVTVGCSVGEEGEGIRGKGAGGEERERVGNKGKCDAQLNQVLWERKQKTGWYTANKTWMVVMEWECPMYNIRLSTSWLSTVH